MKPRFILAGIVLFVLLTITTLLTLPYPVAPALSVRSQDDNGSMALKLWLSASGYQVQEVTSRTDQLETIDLLFILNPITDLNEKEAHEVRNWVREGHILIIAGRPYFTETLLEAFEVQMRFLTSGDLSLSAAAPTLLDPPFDSARVEAQYWIETERLDAVPHQFSEGMPVLVSLSEGAGTVWISGGLRPFTNQGLSDAGNARLIANLVASIPRRAVIGFDEVVHGFGEEEQQQTLSAWLFGTSTGWAILMGFGLTMLYLALRGRRFGRAIPLPEAQVRRDSREYIQAIASFFRRSGQRGEIVQHYDRQLRRRLSERYAVDPKLETANLIRVVMERDPNIDPQLLEWTLNDLARRNVNEQELVAIAAKVDRLLRSIH